MRRPLVFLDVSTHTAKAAVVHPDDRRVLRLARRELPADFRFQGQPIA